MRAIELFSGAGGLALGVHLAGFALERLVEIDDMAFETLHYNHLNGAITSETQWDILHERVEDVDFGEFENVDLVAAGIPCQPFSNGGHRRGLNDHRNLFPTFVGVLNQLRPKAFLVENVSGLTAGDMKKQLAYIQLHLSYPFCQPAPGQKWQTHYAQLKRLGQKVSTDLSGTYKVKCATLNAADFGVAQLRKRVFLVGFRRDLNVDWSFPTPTHSKDALIYDQWITHQYWLRHGKRKVAAPRPSSDTLARLARLKQRPGLPWRTVRDEIENLPSPGRKSSPPGTSQHVYIPGARAYRGHSGSPLDQPAKAIKAGVHGVPGGENMLRYQNGRVRYFTVRECARLQAFPDSWEFKGERIQMTRQLGNAVPVKLAQVVARSIRKALEDNRTKTQTEMQEVAFTASRDIFLAKPL